MLLEIAVDPGRLFYRDDPMFEHWLAMLIDRVSHERRRQAREAKQGA